MLHFVSKIWKIQIPFKECLTLLFIHKVLLGHPGETNTVIFLQAFVDNMKFVDSDVMVQ